LLNYVLQFNNFFKWYTEEEQIRQIEREKSSRRREAIKEDEDVPQQVASSWVVLTCSNIFTQSAYNKRPPVKMTTKIQPTDLPALLDYSRKPALNDSLYLVIV